MLAKCAWGESGPPVTPMRFERRLRKLLSSNSHLHESGIVEKARVTADFAFTARPHQEL